MRFAFEGAASGNAHERICILPLQGGS
jgi:hypothetical protein